MRAITVVTPCFNEELNVQECYEAVRNLFANELAAYRREHIFFVIMRRRMGLSPSCARLRPPIRASKLLSTGATLGL